MLYLCQSGWRVDHIYLLYFITMVMSNIKKASTNDKIIRIALKKRLHDLHARDPKMRIIEELGIKHGAARIDISVVNGVMHGYEIKSDKDTLHRLSEQMNIYNSVFDKITLVVGKSHLYDSINIVPDWWGIVVAKIGTNNAVIFNNIREAETNPCRDPISIAKLLWRNEALNILEEMDEATGMRSKPRSIIYEKLSTVLDRETLGERVREILCFRKDWRSDVPLVSSGG